MGQAAVSESTAATIVGRCTIDDGVGLGHSGGVAFPRSSPGLEIFTTGAEVTLLAEGSPRIQRLSEISCASGLYHSVNRLTPTSGPVRWSCEGLAVGWTEHPILRHDRPRSSGFAVDNGPCPGAKQALDIRQDRTIMKKLSLILLVLLTPVCVVSADQYLQASSTITQCPGASPEAVRIDVTDAANGIDAPIVRQVQFTQAKGVSAILSGDGWGSRW